MKASINIGAASLLTLSLSTFAAAQSGDNCIILKGDNSYSWQAGGTWSGNGQVDGQSHCFSAGSGRISIGAPGAPKGVSGNTLIECFFPGAGNSGQLNCDISLVDGWSAAVTCTDATGGWSGAPNPKKYLGCDYNLKSACPASDWDSANGICHNKNGPHVSALADVDSVFQLCGDTDENPNSAEVYQSMTGAFTFAQFPITCSVGAGTNPPSGGTGGAGTGTGSGSTSGSTKTTDTTKEVSDVVVSPVAAPPASTVYVSAPATPVNNPPAGQHWSGHWGHQKRHAAPAAAAEHVHHVRAIKARSVGDMVMRR